jgi:hypothetical protein
MLADLSQDLRIHARRLMKQSIFILIVVLLRLYERLGFQYGPLPADPGYQTADIYMELSL